MHDVVIIGAGLIGSAVAYRLAEAGASVVTLEAAQPGLGTSSATFAWLNANNKPPRAYHDLNAAGMRAHRELAREFRASPWLHEGGNLEWAASEGEEQRLREKAQRLRDWGYAVETVTPAQVQAELEPDLALSQASLHAAYYYPEEMWLDPLLLIHRLQESARQLGARLLTGRRVIRIETSGGRAHGVVTESGERIAADMIVNCAGRDAGRVSALAGWELPMANTAGLLALTAPAPACISHVIHAPHLNLRPDGAGRLLLHSEEIDKTLDGKTEASVALPGCQELLRRAQALLPSLAGTRIEVARIGVRPIPGDGLSTVGPLPGVDGVYAAVTHSGATLCAVLGRLVAHEIMTGQQAPELAPFRPARFA